MTAMEGIMKFQTSRGLHTQEYEWIVEATNVVEELFEALGLNDRSRAKMIVRDMMDIVEERNRLAVIATPSIHDQVDAFGDVIVFSIGALTKLGYNPEKVLQEISKQINSRSGRIINGKFVKNKSPEAKKLEYQANFSDCKLDSGRISILQRQAFFRTEGYMGTDDEVEVWLKKLTT